MAFNNDLDIDNIPEPTPIHKIRNDHHNPQKNQQMMQMHDLHNKMIMNEEPEMHNKHLINSLTQEIIKNLEEKKLNLEEDDENDNYTSRTNRSQRSRSNSKEKDVLLNIVSNKLEEDFEIEKNYSKNMITSFFEDYFNYKEFLILLGIYFLLSQEMIKDTIGSYFTSINEDENGRVQMKGVLIYGILLCVLFIVARKIIL